MKIFLVGVIVGLPLLASVPEQVQTANGLVAGTATATTGVRAFKGIPFAAPPTGDLRWRSPKPAANWQGVRKADRFADACMQPQRAPDPLMRPDDGPASEDCLYLNVWTPARNQGDKLPVMVWIHGGGFRSGAASMPHYNGEYVAGKGVIVVSISYRLGLFGFFAHPELTKESDNHASGNYAVQDMIAALQWINTNVAAFGGDPQRVTVWGQSAGAEGVNALIASPLGKGLFIRAIAQSGGLGGSLGVMGAHPSLGTAEKSGVAFATARGAHSLAELRAQSGESLRNAAWNTAVITDGRVLPEEMLDIFRGGRQNNVAFLGGSNGDEGQRVPGSAEEFKKQAETQFGSMAPAFLKIFPANTLEEATTSQITSAASRVFFGMWNEARLQTRNTKSKAYLYLFTHAPPLPKGSKLPGGTSEAFGLGAYHGAELTYQFMTLKTRDWPWTAADYKLADDISSYWVNFAKNGDPNGAGLEKWPVYDETADQILEIGDKIQARTAPRRAALDFYARRLTEQQTAKH